VGNREVMVSLFSQLDLGSSFYVFCEGYGPCIILICVVFLVTLDLVPYLVWHRGVP